MDLIVKTTNKKFYEIDSQIGTLLVNALPDIFERLEKPKPAPLSNEWVYICGMLPTGQKYAVQRKRPREIQYCPEGNPAAVARVWPECPPDVIAQFAGLRSEERIGFKG